MVCNFWSPIWSCGISVIFRRLHWTVTTVICTEYKARVPGYIPSYLQNSTGILDFARSPENFCGFCLRSCLGILHWNMAGISGEFFWPPFPTKRSTKLLKNSGQNSGQNSWWQFEKNRATFVLQSFWPKELLLTRNASSGTPFPNVQF